MRKKKAITAAEMGRKGGRAKGKSKSRPSRLMRRAALVRHGLIPLGGLFCERNFILRRDGKILKDGRNRVVIFSEAAANTAKRIYRGRVEILPI